MIEAVPQPRRLFIIAILAGSALRILQTATSLGSFDALLWYRWVELIDRVGILRSYLYSEYMNHPPLALLVAQVTNRIGAALGLGFSDSFRYLQCAADVVATIFLLRIARRIGVKDPLEHALMFFLSPAVIFISAFHCNSDPLMMMFVVVAVAMVLEERPAAGGIALAAGIGIKILPLLVAPLLLLACRGRAARLRFGGAAAAGLIVIFVPGLVVSGPTFLRDIFGYKGMPTGWGFRIVGEHVRQLTGWNGIGVLWRYASLLTVIAVAVLWLFAWKRSRAAGEAEASRLPALVATTYLVVLFLAPGFGVQYLFWPLPFLAFAVERRLALLLHGLASIFTFALYTSWVHGWPWWYAAGNPTRADLQMVSAIGIVLWLAMGTGGVAALSRLIRTKR